MLADFLDDVKNRRCETLAVTEGSLKIRVSAASYAMSIRHKGLISKRIHVSLGVFDCVQPIAWRRDTAKSSAGAQQNPTMYQLGSQYLQPAFGLAIHHSRQDARSPFRQCTWSRKDSCMLEDGINTMMCQAYKWKLTLYIHSSPA